MRLRNLAAFAAVALLAALPAVAQEQVGSIEGVVRDAQGGAVVGATVVAKSARGASADSVSDATGTYRFNALAPGRYELTANLSGFAPAKVQNVDLRLGQQLSINMTLSPSGVTETVQVVGESPLIAITQSARATSIRDEEITKMPKGRDFTSLVAQAAGANPEMAKLGGLSVDGSSGGENRFIVDGAEATNIQTGAGRNVATPANGGASTSGDTTTGAGMRMVTDFVEEVQIKSSGYAAEYGGSTGAVVNVLTKSGSNQFRGDVGAYYSGSSLEADPRPSLRLKPTDSRQAEYVTFEEDSYDRWEPGFTLGGPLARDKAWFFVGYNPSFRPYERTAKFNDGSVGTKKQDLTDQYISANLTAQFSPKLRSRFAYNNSRRKQEGRLQSQSVAADATGASNPLANYDINDVAEALRHMVTLAPSLELKVHCGGDYESDTCVATVTVHAGEVSVGPAEVPTVGEGLADLSVARLGAILGGWS